LTPPLTPENDGNEICAVPTLTIGLPLPYVWSAPGSTWIEMPVAVTFSAPVTSISSFETPSVNSPGTLNAASSADGSLIAFAAFSRSI
jgi:hypothetical protein